MHLLRAQPGVTLPADSIADLGQTPAELVILCTGDSHLSLLAEVAREESPISRAQHYALDNLDEELSVERLAGVAGMSARHFARMFAREVRLTPMEFVQSARLDRARNLLETSDLPLKTVAYRAGFRSVRCMRMQFSDRLGLTPAQYRHQFG